MQNCLGQNCCKKDLHRIIDFATTESTKKRKRKRKSCVYGFRMRIEISKEKKNAKQQSSDWINAIF